MMGHIVYFPREAEKNRGFIRLFQEKGASAGIHFAYVSVQEYTKCRDSGLPDFVLNRTRQPQVSRWYQDRDVPVFHVDSLVELANDKYRSLQYLKQHLPEKIRREKWCPDSRLLGAAEMEEIAMGRSTLPGNMVIKSLDGHGGSEVFLTEEETGVAALRGKDCLLQERISSHGRDLRVYILGGEIYQAVLRTGNGDFRSNFSLGGEARVFDLSVEQADWIRQFVRVLPGASLGMFGIDFIVGRDGRLYFNEVEEMAGCRMLYQCSDRDIVGDYVAWLHTFMEKNSCISGGI